MKKMRVLITLAGALCVLAFAAGAWAQEEESNDEADLGESDLADAIDFAEAVENAVLVNSFEDDDGAWEVYWDDLQGFMWEQRAGLSSEEAVESLENNTLDSRTLMTPDYLRVYYHYWVFPTGCTSTNTSSTFTSYFLDSSCGSGCYRYTFTGTTYIPCVYGAGTRGTTGSSNYCEFDWCDQECFHHKPGGIGWFEQTTSCYCQEGWEEYLYYNTYVAWTGDPTLYYDDLLSIRYKIDSSNWRIMMVGYTYLE